jgi:hypothetical protein
MAKERDREIANENEVIVGVIRRNKPVRRPKCLCDDVIKKCPE